MKMVAAPSASQLHSPFLYCPLKPSTSISLSRKSLKSQQSPALYPCVRAVDLDQNTIVAISVGVVSVAVGIGIPVFYETQIDNADNYTSLDRNWVVNLGKIESVEGEKCLDALQSCETDTNQLCPGYAGRSHPACE